MRKQKTFITAVLLGAVMALYPAVTFADDFYAGKSINIIVGYRAGGGYDTYTRIVARHLGKHIAGNPSIVVENKGGAGSKLAANYLYARSRADGLTAGVFGGGLMTQQALGAKGANFDGRKFKWVGSMAGGNPACVIMGFTGLKTLDDVLASKKTLKMGSTGAGSTTDDLPKLMKGLMGANFDVVSGFKGTNVSSKGWSWACSLNCRIWSLRSVFPRPLSPGSMDDGSALSCELIERKSRNGWSIFRNNDLLSR